MLSAMYEFLLITKDLDFRPVNKVPDSNAIYPLFRKQCDDRIKKHIVESTTKYIERKEREKMSVMILFESKAKETITVNNLFILSFTGIGFLYLYHKFRT